MRKSQPDTEKRRTVIMAWGFKGTQEKIQEKRLNRLANDSSNAETPENI